MQDAPPVAKGTPVWDEDGARTAASAVGADIRLAALDRFFGGINERYLSNPYHNGIHGAQVCHLSFCLARCFGMTQTMDRGRAFAILVASVGHDVGHLGTSSAFLVECRHPLCVVYNDSSVLENYHAAVTCAVLNGQTALFGPTWVASDIKAFRAMVIEMILATDMAKHFTTVRRVQEVRTGGPGMLYPLDPRAVHRWQCLHVAPTTCLAGPS